MNRKKKLIYLKAPRYVIMADKKDVKLPSSSSLFSKGLSASAPAPVSRSGKPKIRVQKIVEDYVSVNGDETPSPLPSPIQRSKVDGCPGETENKSTLDESAELRQKYAAEAQLLEQKFLAQRREKNDPSDYKHFYVLNPFLVNPWTASGQQNAYPICIPALGTGVNQRIGNVIALISARVRISIILTPTGVSTQNPVWPEITLMMIRDKLPITPGTLPALYADDTNPPSSQTALFSRLGLAQAPQNDRTAVINPSAYNRYHLYHISHHMTSDIGKQDIQTTSVTNPVNSTINVRTKQIDLEIPLHKVQVVFPGFASVNPIQNAVYFVMRCDYASAALDTANGFFPTYTMSVDTKYCDVQEDCE